MFNPHYAICSIIILFFLTSLYVTRKNPPTRRNYAYIALLICSWAISITSLILSFVLAEIIYIIVSVLIYLYYEADKKVGFYINGSEMYFQGLTKRKYIISLPTIPTT